MSNILNRYSKLFDGLAPPIKTASLVVLIFVILLSWYYSFWLNKASELKIAQNKINVVESQLPDLKNRLRQLEDENRRRANNYAVQLKRDIKTTLHQLMSRNHNLALIELHSSIHR
jgi:hypothetical protein